MTFQHYDQCIKFGHCNTIPDQCTQCPCQAI